MAEEGGLWPMTGTEDRGQAKAKPPRLTPLGAWREEGPPTAPVTALSSWGPDSSQLRSTLELTFLPAEGPGWPREVPTCLVHHRGEVPPRWPSGPLCHLTGDAPTHFRKKPAPQELRREHERADVLESNTGW